MGKRNWTTGPWSADPNTLHNGDEIWVGPDNGDGSVIAAVWPWGDDEVGTGEREANAHLIAAAPELYEALAKAAKILDRNFMEVGGDGNDVLDEAKAALAKARGEVTL